MSKILKKNVIWLITLLFVLALLVVVNAQDNSGANIEEDENIALVLAF